MKKSKLILVLMVVLGIFIQINIKGAGPKNFEVIRDSDHMLEILKNDKYEETEVINLNAETGSDELESNLVELKSFDFKDPKHYTVVIVIAHVSVDSPKNAVFPQRAYTEEGFRFQPPKTLSYFDYIDVEQKRLEDIIVKIMKENNINYKVYYDKYLQLGEFFFNWGPSYGGEWVENVEDVEDVGDGERPEVVNSFGVSIINWKKMKIK